MNKQQREYALSRVNGLANAKIQKFESVNPPVDVGISSSKKIDAIFKGAAKLKPRADINRYTDLIEAYSYPEDMKADKAAKARDAKVEAFKARVMAEATRIRDQIILGDSAEALKLIEAFDKF